MLRVLERPDCVRMWNVSLYGNVCPLARRDTEWLFYGPVLIGLNIISLVANTLVILTCIKRMSRLRGLMIQVAVADILYVLTFTVYNMPRSLQRYYHIHWLQDWANYMLEERRIFRPMANICKTVSVWMVLLVISERFAKMWKPSQWEKVFNKVTISCVNATILVLSVFICVPQVEIQAGFRWECKSCQGVVANTRFYKPFEGVMVPQWMRLLGTMSLHGGSLYIMFDYGIPFAIITSMMILISMERSRQTKLEKKTGAETKTDYDEFNMVSSMIIFYIVCELPNYLAYDTYAESKVQIKLVRILTLSSSCYKLFAYFISGEGFRETFWSILSCRHGKRNEETVNQETLVKYVD